MSSFAFLSALATSTSVSTGTSANTGDSSAPAQTGTKDSGDFLALLDAAVAGKFGAVPVTGNTVANANSEAGAFFHNSSSGKPFAQPQPSQQASNNNAPQQTQQTQQSSSQPLSEQGTNHSQQSNQPSNQSPAKAPDNNNQNTNSDNNNSTNNAPTTQQANASPDDSSDNKTDDSLPSQKQLRSALGDQLGNIDQILAAIIQFLSASAAGSAAAATATTPAPATPATDTSATAGVSDVAATGAATGDTTGQILPLPVSSDAASAAPTDTGTTASELAMLKDLQLMVSQLQQALQGTGTTQASATTASATSASTQTVPLPISSGSSTQDASVPDAFIQQALAQLSQMTQPKPGDNTSAAPATTTPAPKAAGTPTAPTDNTTPTAPALPSTDNLVSLIKASISDVRQKLQTLNNQNEAIFSQVQNSSSLDTKQLFTDALAANSNTTPTTITYSAAVAPQAEATPAAPLPQVSEFIATGITLTQQGSDNSSNSGSNSNGQGQPQAQAITQPGTAQTQGSTAAGSASFSKMLAQQSQAPLNQQLAFQVKTALNDGSSKITIQLHPEDLGKVNVALSVDASGKTSVTVTADNHHTLQLLQNDSQGLAKALNDAGLKTDSGSLNFNLGNGGGQGQQQQQQANNQNTINQPLTTYQNTQPDDEQETNLSVLTQSYVVNVAEGLDIQI